MTVLGIIEIKLKSVLCVSFFSFSYLAGEEKEPQSPLCGTPSSPSLSTFSQLKTREEKLPNRNFEQ